MAAETSFLLFHPLGKLWTEELREQMIGKPLSANGRESGTVKDAAIEDGGQALRVTVELNDLGAKVVQLALPPTVDVVEFSIAKDGSRG